VRLSVRRLPEDGTPLPKHVGVILIMNCVSGFVFYCTLLSAFFGQCFEYREKHRTINLKNLIPVFDKRKEKLSLFSPRRRKCE
jgi:hypothetical protein